MNRIVLSLDELKNGQFATIERQESDYLPVKWNLCLDGWIIVQSEDLGVVLKEYRSLPFVAPLR